MLDNRYDLSPLLVAYPADYQPTKPPEHVAAGGYSGSRLWLLTAPAGQFCVRRWPEEYSDAVRLQWIHRVITGVFRSGFRAVPVPIPAISGETVLRHYGYLWQLEPWLTGTADIDGTSAMPNFSSRVEAALTALAEFHTAVVADPANRLPDSPPPGLVKRLAQIEKLNLGELDELAAAIAVQGHVWPELAARAAPLLKMFRAAAPRIAELLRRAAGQSAPIRPCIRDIHREHVLFTSNRVTGIVDFGAMQPDHVAGDVARLLGSFAGGDPDLWEMGWRAYQQRNPLPESQHALMQIYDDSGVLLSGIQWLRWVFVEGRQFENRSGVLARFEVILGRLARLAERTSTSAGVIV